MLGRIYHGKVSNEFRHLVQSRQYMPKDLIFTMTTGSLHDDVDLALIIQHMNSNHVSTAFEEQIHARAFEFQTLDPQLSYIFWQVGSIQNNLLSVAID